MNDPLYRSLAEPLGFSSFADILFPDDRILLVPDAEIAVEPRISAKIVKFLLKYEMKAENVSVLLMESEEKALTESSQLPTGVPLVIHHPERRDRLALLGVDVDDQPIALNRELVDADMVITIGRFHPKKQSTRQRNYFGVHSAVFPRFADGETIRRFSEAKGTERRKLRNEVEEVARQLGIVFTVQLLRQRGEPDRFVVGRPDLVLVELEK